MKKRIIASLVAGLMVTNLSAELTENDTTYLITTTEKDESNYVDTTIVQTLVNKPSNLSLWEIE